MKAMTVLAALAAVTAGLTGSPAWADDAAMLAAATSTRAQWNAIVGRHQPGFGSKAATPPVLNSVSVATSGVGVSNAPRPVTINFNATSAAGLSTVLVDIRSRDYEQGYRREITLPNPVKGAFQFDSPSLSSLNEPGAWDIRFVGVCDVQGQCAELDFYGLDPVAERAFNVTNARTPDLKEPVVTSALLGTTALQTSSTNPALVFLKFGLSDGGTGVTLASVCARPPAEAYEVCGWWELPAAKYSGLQWVTIPFEGNAHEAGTWHIAVVEMVDRAGNQLFVNDPAQLDAMFPNGRTFTLTNGP
jgi:hypothetical protein